MAEVGGRGLVLFARGRARGVAKFDARVPEGVAKFNGRVLDRLVVAERRQRRADGGGGV